MSEERPGQRIFDYTKAEVVTGVFVLLGLLGVAYLSVSIGGLRILPRDEYRVTARFSNVGDLKARAPVKVAGVTVGRVQSIRLADYYGETELAIARNVTLPKDTIASIATAGLLGDAYVSLSPGGAETNLHDGDRITHTEPALNMADIIGRTAFGGPSPSSPPTEPAPRPVPKEPPP
jgi:phospholipid/cholesterol/gamma-HCH transport system substrate-binding protein